MEMLSKRINTQTQKDLFILLITTFIAQWISLQSSSLHY